MLFPLTHSQLRIVVNQQIFEDSRFAYMYGSVIIGDQNAERLSEAINAAISFFDCLRIRFTRAGSRILQSISGFQKEDIRSRPIGFDFFSERMDLYDGKLYRFYIIEEKGKPSGYFFVLHHAIVDAYTITLIIKYIDEYLKNETEDQRPRSFREFVSVEQNYLKSEDFKDDSRFFEDRLSSSSNYKYVPEFDLSSNRIEKSLPGEQTRAMLSYCKQKNISLFKLVYAALFLLLYSENGRTTQTVSTTHHNRNTEELLLTGGMLTSTIPVIQEIDFSLTLEGFLDIVSSNISVSLEKHRFPIDILLTDAKLKSSFDLNITEVILNSIPFGDGSDIRRISPNEDVARLNFKLNPNSKPKGADIEIAVDYRKSVYTPSKAGYLLDRLVELAFKFIERGGAVISDIIPPSDDVIRQLEKSVLENPERLALSDGVTNITYGQLGEKVDAVAGALHKSGQVIGVIGERSPWYVASVLGVLKAGRAFTVLDPGLPKRRLEDIVRQARVGTILAFSDAEHSVNGADIDIIDVRELKPEENPIPICVGDLAYILFTSGSAGAPKGVMVGRKGLLSLIRALSVRYGTKGKEKYSAFCDFSFDVSIAEIFLPLTTASTLFVAGEEQRHDLKLLDGFMRNNKIDRAFLPTKLGEAFIKNFPDCPISSLTIAGEKMNYCQHTRYVVFNGYGPTEFTVLSHMEKIAGQSARYSIGPPLDGVTDMIASDTGELILIGEQSAFGYLNDYSLTTDRFTKFLNNDKGAYQRAFRTADKVERGEDGKIYFLSRMDRQIKHNGYRIEPGEIERLAIDSALVKDAVCTYSENEITLTVIPGEHYEENGLARALSEKLPRYAMPHRFAAVSEFPKTKIGKIDYTALEAAPAPDPKRGSFAAKDPAEKKLTDIFSKYLSGRSREISVSDNIFSMGIDSLDIIQIMLEVEKELKQPVRFSAFIMYPTIKELASHLSSRSDGRCIAKLREGEGSPLAVVFDMSRDIFAYRILLDSLKPGYPVYGVSSDHIPRDASLVEYAGGLTKALLEQEPFDHIDLAGYSSGGIVALEMARQLGEKAGHVFMIDTPNYRVYPKYANYSFLLKNIFRVLSFSGLSGLVAYTRKLIGKNKKGGNAFTEGKKLIKAIRGYEPKIPGTPVSLIASSETAARTSGELGWKSLIRDDMIVYLDGGHISIMKSGAPTIASIIDSSREKAISGGSPAQEV